MGIVVQCESGVQESEALLSDVADIACGLGKLLPFKPVFQSVEWGSCKTKIVLLAWIGNSYILQEIWL